MPGLNDNYIDFISKMGGGLPRLAFDALQQARQSAGPGPSPDVAPPTQFRMEELNPSRGQLQSHAAAEANNHPGVAAPPPTPDPMDAEMAKARAGFEKGGWTDPSIDWKAEREGFLAQGNADRMGEEAADAPRAAQSIFPWGRTVGDQVSDETAFRGLQEARSMQDPGYRRQQRTEDALTDDAAFVDPRAQAARGMRRDEGLDDKRAQAELMQMLQSNPAALAAAERAFGQKRELAEIDAKGRGGALGMMLGGGGGGGAPAAGGKTVPMVKVQAYAQREGISIEAAMQKVQAEGYTVAQ